MRIAIVGSESKHWTPKTRELACKKIKEILINDDYLDYHNNNPDDPIYPTLISGGCPKGGVDIWAEIIADFIGLEKTIYYPEVNRWKPNGYEERNDRIAQECDILYCIDPESRKWSGGRWTMKRAEFYGRETHLILIEEKENESTN